MENNIGSGGTPLMSGVHVGDRVRVTTGRLDGVEGIVVDNLGQVPELFRLLFGLPEDADGLYVEVVGEDEPLALHSGEVEVLEHIHAEAA